MPLKNYKKEETQRLKRMQKNKTHCDNCGHECHCGGYCFESKKKEGVCCTRCKHQKKKVKNAKR
jgi:hypothetical protein